MLTSERRYVKTICAKMWARKNTNRPVSGFFTKTAYVQVMNFIPVKVSTLYKGNVCSIRDEVREIRRLNNRRS
jgi:hypothetical protein